ncbi:LysR family transcriptional regulator [Acidovorax sp. SDU_ACID1]|uniref:LysR family transcriptional regulator n=1 Tax=Acidovorax sp. SDU_ACID1 TaxID=3136632 RepID=UPI003873957A
MAYKCDLVDLQLIVHIVESRSLTAGAERTFLSPPAASARLKKSKMLSASSCSDVAAMGWRQPPPPSPSLNMPVPSLRLTID